MTELLPEHPEPSRAQAALLAAPEDAQRLAQILALEFDALKTRDLAAFELLQEEKNQALERLAALAAWASTQSPAPVLWQQLQEPLLQCKQDHMRNIQLLQRQLQAVRGTLQALQGDSAPAVDLYDRMGQIARRQGAWGYHLA
jgi:flagellar biosynthesis/type III secretory pathway chaperone